MLIVGLFVAAIGGSLYVYWIGRRRARKAAELASRTGLGALIAVIGAAIAPILLKNCGFAEGTTGVDHVLMYGLMFGGASVALIAARWWFDRKDAKESAEEQAITEIRTGGFRIGWWVPWALLAPTLAVLVVFLYFPAISTFALSTKLTRLGAPKSVDICLNNFTELLIDEPFKLVLYPLLAVAAIYGARFWLKRSTPGSVSHRTAEVASALAIFSVFVALYAIFSTGGGGSIAYRPVYVVTMIISIGTVAFGMILGLAIAYLAFRSIRGITTYRTFLIWPYAISPAIAGILFFMILDPTAGILSHITTEWLGLDFPNYRTNSILAQAAIITASGWKILGYNVLFYLAGLQNVSRDQIEAAALDGASAWQRFTNIIIPALSPITFFLLITNLTYAFFEVFATIDYMTKGAPAGATSVAIFEIIRVGVDNGDLGRGAAQSVVLFAAVIGITVWQFRSSDQRVNYGGG